MRLLMSTMSGRILPVFRHRMTTSRSISKKTSSFDSMPARRNSKLLNLNGRIDSFQNIKEYRKTTTIMTVREFCTKKPSDEDQPPLSVYKQFF